MADKKLLTLFNRCKFDDDELKLYNDARVTRVAANTQYRVLKVDIIFTKYVCPDSFLSFSNKVKCAYDLSEFNAKYSFENVEFCRQHWKDLLFDTKTRNPAANGFLNDSEFETDSNKIVVTVHHGGVDILNEMKVGKTISELLYERYNVKYTVEFLSSGKEENYLQSSFYTSENVIIQPPANHSE